MASFNHPLYFYDASPLDYSSETFNPASTSAQVNDAPHTKTNHLTRTSSLTDIRNLPEPSTTTTHDTPSSPPYLPYLDLWDENAFPPIDIPFPATPIASQPLPSSSMLQPPDPSSSDAVEVEENGNHGDPPLQDPSPSDPRGIWEISTLSLDADEYGVHDCFIIAEVTYLQRSDPPLEPDFLGESEYARARRHLEFQQPLCDPLPDSPPRPSVLPPSPEPEPQTATATPNQQQPSDPLPDSPARSSARLPSPEPESEPELEPESTTATSSSSDTETAAELPRRSQRERTTPSIVEDPQTPASTSAKGKGKAVAREPVPASASSQTGGKSKRKREASVEEDAPPIAEANPTPPPAFKKQKLTAKQVKGMMVSAQLPDECGCGFLFDEQEVPAMVSHFAGHYSEEEKKAKGKLPCRWGQCETELTYGQLVRHVKNEHLKARWPCPDCGTLFTRPNGITRHKTMGSACMKNRAAAESQASQ